jgi:integration host factor subunit beta
MNVSLEDAKSIVKTIITAMADALVQGENVELRGFGSFHVRNYEGYVGRNPRTGAEFRVGPKKLPYFKLSKDLRERINDELTK